MEELKTDLININKELAEKVEEFNRINTEAKAQAEKNNIVREQLIQQIQQLNGVSTYLRGKVISADTETQEEKVEDDSLDKGDEAFERSVEYPPTKKK
tara:strand:- start:988 stop:1281 length:294 start_codon:yes stop_codon:yes gene_type:complete